MKTVILSAISGVIVASLVSIVLIKIDRNTATEAPTVVKFRTWEEVKVKPLIPEKTPVVKTERIKNKPILLPIQEGIGTRQELMNLVNETRITNGLNGLLEDTRLNNAAQLKAEDIVNKGYFSHNTPEGSQFWVWLDGVGYKFSYAGENLAQNFTSLEAAHNALMESEKHRENILSTDYTHMGVGIAQTKAGIWYIVEMFAVPAGE